MIRSLRVSPDNIPDGYAGLELPGYFYLAVGVVVGIFLTLIGIFIYKAIKDYINQEPKD